MTQRLFWILWASFFGLFSVYGVIFTDTTKWQYILDVIYIICNTFVMTYWIMKKDNQ